MTTDTMQNPSTTPPTAVKSMPGATDATAQTDGSAPAQPVATASQVLKTAIELLAKHGWCQGNYMDGNGSVCAMEALFLADPTPLNVIGLDISSRAMSFIGPLNLTAWNDMYGTTYEDVISLFKNLATLYESEGN